MKRINKLIGLIAVAALLPTTAFAGPIPVVNNQVIIDNAPFYSVGPEDSSLGSGNYALNHPGFIDIPYVIFDFGSTTSVSSAILNWNFRALYGGSGAAEITLYVGNDASGTISVGDRFMGTAVDTFTYSGGETRNFDLTSFVNASLLSGQYFAARFEATAAPGTLSGHYGGNFLTPSMDATAGTVSVPEPATLALLGLGFAGMVFSKRRLKT